MHLYVSVRETSWFIMLCKCATLLQFSLVPVAPDNSHITANRDVLRQQKDTQDIPWTLGTKRSEFMFLMPAGFTDVNIIKIEMKDSQWNKSDQTTLYSQWLTPNELSALLDQERYEKTQWSASLSCAGQKWIRRSLIQQWDYGNPEPALTTATGKWQKQWWFLLLCSDRSSQKQ